MWPLSYLFTTLSSRHSAALQPAADQSRCRLFLSKPVFWTDRCNIKQKSAEGDETVLQETKVDTKEWALTHPHLKLTLSETLTSYSYEPLNGLLWTRLYSSNLLLIVSNFTEQIDVWNSVWSRSAADGSTHSFSRRGCYLFCRAGTNTTHLNADVVPWICAETVSSSAVLSPPSLPHIKLYIRAMLYFWTVTAGWHFNMYLFYYGSQR